MRDHLAVAKIIVAGQRGTGVLVAEDLVLTALHVVADRSDEMALSFRDGPIKVSFQTYDCEAVVAERSWDARNDWVVLRCLQKPPIQPLPLHELHESPVNWWTHGFSNRQPVDGMTYDGRVVDHRTRLEGVPALQLFSEQIAAEHVVGDGADNPVGGLSGAPVIVDGSVVGIVRFALGRGHPQAGTVYATPTKNILANDRASIIPPSDPYLGLPRLPAIDPPEEPFRYLSQYRREDAPVFFGRGWEIRSLYGSLTAPKEDSPPVVFLVGQSGVGKSSLLTAGVFPRFELQGGVVYLRRTSELPLPMALAQAIPTGSSWIDLELQSFRPYFIMLDQAEEVFLQDSAEITRELEPFMLRVREVLGHPEHRPQGRLTLAFRKEWLQEWDRAFREFAIPRRVIRIDPLTKDGVREVVLGLSSSERLRNYYRIERIDPALADELAHRLSRDKEANISPLLQVWMTELWNDAVQQSSDSRALTLDRFKALDLERLTIKKFLNQQLQKILPPFDRHLATGLVLDILTEHSSSHGDPRTLSAITKAKLYVAQPERTPNTMRGLEAELRRVGLLIEPLGPGASKGDTRLVHDTLIPEVRELFDSSAMPGQRARRVLEARVSEWIDGRPGPVLDEHDLHLAEMGRWGMRNWTADEERLVGASGKKRDQSRRRRLLGYVAAAAAMMIIILLAGLEFRTARLETNAKLDAMHQQRLAQATSFTMAARSLVDSAPESAALYAAEGIKLAHNDDAQSAAAEEVLRVALSHISTIAHFAPGRFEDGMDQMIPRGVSSISITQDENTLAYGTEDGEVYIWQLGGRDRYVLIKTIYTKAQEWKKFFTIKSDPVNVVRFAFGDRWLIVRERDRSIHCFDTRKGFEEIEHPPEWQYSADVSVSPNGETVATIAGNRHTLMIWQLGSDGVLKMESPLHTEAPIESLTFSQDSGTVVLQYDQRHYATVTLEGLAARDILLPEGTSYLDPREQRRDDDEPQLTRINPNGHILLTSQRYSSGYVEPQRKAGIWDISGGQPKELRSFLAKQPGASISDADFSPDGGWLAIGHDFEVLLWDLSRTSPKGPASLVIPLGRNAFYALSFDHQSKKLAVTTFTGRTFLVELIHGPDTQPIEVSGIGPVRPLFSRSDRWLAAGDEYSNTVRVCDVTRNCGGLEGTITPVARGRFLGCSSNSTTWLIGTNPVRGTTVWNDRGRSQSLLAAGLPRNTQTGGKATKLIGTCSPDGHWMLEYSTDSPDKYLLDLSTTEPVLAIQRVDNLPAKVEFAVFDRTSSWLIAGNDKEAYVVSPYGSGPKHAQPLEGYEGGMLLFSPRGEWLVEETKSSYKDGKVTTPLLRKVDKDAIGKAIPVSVSSNPLVNFTFSEDDSTLFASESVDNPFSADQFEATRPGAKAFVWDMRAGFNLAPKILSGHRGMVHGVFSPDGKWLATADGMFAQRQKEVQLWKTDHLENSVWTFETEAPAQILYPMFDPESKWFIFGNGVSADFYALSKILRDSHQPQPDFSIQSGTTITSHWNLYFSPDSRWFVNQGHDEPLRIWLRSDDGGARLVATDGDQSGEGITVVFAPDSRHLITSSSFTTLWTLSRSSDSVKKVTVPGGGAALLRSNGQDVTILAAEGPASWTLGTDDLLSRAQSAVGRNMTLSEWTRVLPQNPYERTFDTLPSDVSVIRDYVLRAQEAAARGARQEARGLYAMAVKVSIEAKNPFAAMRVADAGLSDGMPRTVRDAATFAAAEMPQNFGAVELRGLALAGTGDSGGIDDLQKYIEWAAGHRETSQDLQPDMETLDALRKGQIKSPERN